ncbi:MAG: glycosyltransferase, partial [Alphaproteobacteria bacterium]
TGSARDLRRPKVAVLLPCYNESASIVAVIDAMRAALPDAAIYVYDINSPDNTAALALGAGAIVGFEARKGKGNVVRRMFADVEADIYVMADGDGTYDATAAPRMIARLVDGDLDMVTGTREGAAQGAYRLGHRFGNALLTNLVTQLFGKRIGDMLSGYRIMSHRFVKSFPAMSQGFEIETELTVHALSLSLPTDEIGAPYGSRGADSASKLNTFRDGFRILGTILMLLYSERPLLFFGLFAGLATVISLFIAYPVFLDFWATGLVPRFPTAFLAMVLMLVALMCLCCGLILKTVTKGRQEMKHLAYLQIRSVRAALTR